MEQPQALDFLAQFLQARLAVRLVRRACQSMRLVKQFRKRQVRPTQEAPALAFRARPALSPDRPMGLSCRGTFFLLGAILSLAL